MKILVIEDEASIRSLLKENLEKEGYEIFTTGLGKEGLKLFYEINPDLLILDLILPDIDGFEIASSIKTNGKEFLCPIIAITKLSDLSSKLKALESGIDELLVKPFSIEELNLRIKSMLRMKSYYDALKLEQERFKNIIFKMKDGIIFIDNKTKDVIINDVARKILGFKENEYISFEKIKNPPNLNEQFFPLDYFIKSKSLNLTKDIYIEYPIPLYLTIDFNKALLNGEKILGIIINIRDKTEKEKLAHLQNEFISLASHELRTPVTTIKNALDILIKKNVGTWTENQAKFLKIAYQNTNRLKNLVNNILEMSRLQAGRLRLKFEKINLNELLSSLIYSLNLEGELRKQNLIFEPEFNLPYIIGDKTRLEEIVYNLMSNAIKFTPENGTITVKTMVDSTINPKKVILQVSDTGRGIPKKDLPKIFNKFYQVETSGTASIKGSGLGLAIVKTLVEAHQGDIKVESKVGKGTTFLIEFPIFSPTLMIKLALRQEIEIAKRLYRPVSLILIRPSNPKDIKILLNGAKNTIFRKTDQVLVDESTNIIGIILVDNEEKDISFVINRFLDNIKFKYPPENVEIAWANFPEDGNDALEIFNQCYNKLKDKDKVKEKS